MSVYHVYTVPVEARRRLWIPMDLELRMVVSSHVGLGTEHGLPEHEVLLRAERSLYLRPPYILRQGLMVNLASPID